MSEEYILLAQEDKEKPPVHLTLHVAGQLARCLANQVAGGISGLLSPRRLFDLHRATEENDENDRSAEVENTPGEERRRNQLPPMISKFQSKNLRQPLPIYPSIYLSRSICLGAPDRYAHREKSLEFLSLSRPGKKKKKDGKEARGRGCEEEESSRLCRNSELPLFSSSSFPLHTAVGAGHRKAARTHIHMCI